MQLANLKEELGSEIEKLTEEYKSKKEKVVDELIHSGLNRRSLVSQKFHSRKPWVSKFFFGKPWTEHKARGEACFARIVPGFSCEVDGVGDITEFEKYCMCCMIAWQGFLNPTVAAIYDRSPSSISRYRSEWMPRLGLAGANMSELDMEMTHNMLDVKYCKEKGLAYFEDGIAFNINLN